MIKYDDLENSIKGQLQLEARKNATDPKLVYQNIMNANGDTRLIGAILNISEELVIKVKGYNALKEKGSNDESR